MRPRIRSAFWTIVAAIAGVIGAAAAVYPLLTEQQLVHVAFNMDAEQVRLHTMSEPVVLTGKWVLKKRRPVLWDQTVLAGTEPEPLFFNFFANRHIPANGESRILVESNQWQRNFSERGRVEPCKDGEFEIGIEFRSKSGLSFGYGRLPYCEVGY